MMLLIISCLITDPAIVLTAGRHGGLFLQCPFTSQALAQSVIFVGDNPKRAAEDHMAAGKRGYEPAVPAIVRGPTTLHPSTLEYLRQVAFFTDNHEVKAYYHRSNFADNDRMKELIPEGHYSYHGIRLTLEGDGSIQKVLREGLLSQKASDHIVYLTTHRYRAIDVAFYPEAEDTPAEKFITVVMVIQGNVPRDVRGRNIKPGEIVGVYVFDKRNGHRKFVDLMAINRSFTESTTAPNELDPVKTGSSVATDLQLAFQSASQEVGSYVTEILFYGGLAEGRYGLADVVGDMGKDLDLSVPLVDENKRKDRAVFIEALKKALVLLNPLYDKILFSWDDSDRAHFIAREWAYLNPYQIVFAIRSDRVERIVLGLDAAPEYKRPIADCLSRFDGSA